MDRLLATHGHRHGWSLAALLVAIASPLVAWGLVTMLVRGNSCGTWGLDCLSYLIPGTAAGWVAGLACAICGLSRGERRTIGRTAVGLNAVPLILPMVAILLVMNR